MRVDCQLSRFTERTLLGENALEAALHACLSTQSPRRTQNASTRLGAYVLSLDHTYSSSLSGYARPRMKILRFKYQKDTPLCQGECTPAFVVSPDMVASQGMPVTGSFLILSLTIKLTMILLDLSNLTALNLYTELHVHSTWCQHCGLNNNPYICIWHKISTSIGMKPT